MSTIKSKTYESYKLDYLAEKYDSVRNFLYFHNQNLPKVQNHTWDELYKYAAFYFDKPTQKQRDSAFRKIRTEYSNLLDQTSQPSELPTVNSRNELLLWVCKKQNQSQSSKSNNEALANCDINYLLHTYGPDNKFVEKSFEADLKLNY